MACSMRNTFLVFVLLLFFMILYATFDPRRERFVQQQCVGGSEAPSLKKSPEQLLDPDRMEVYQGIPIPDKFKPLAADANADINPSMPSVDGTNNAPKAMYMFSYNRCAPECCKDSPYSCSKGCICLTDNQYNYLDKRGDNREPNGCDFDNHHRLSS